MSKPWIKNLLTAVLLVILALALCFGLRAALNRTSGTFTVEGEEEPVINLEPAWAGTLHFTLSADCETEVNVCTENTGEYITVTEEPQAFTVTLNDRASAVYFYPEEEAALTLTDVTVDFSGMGDALFPKIIIWSLCAAIGLVLTLRLLWSKTPNLPAIAFVLTLSTAVMIALLRPSGFIGWDEETHIDNLMSMFGPAESFTARLNAISLWILGYLPQGLGVMLGRLFGFLQDGCLTTGYLTAALIYAGMAAWTVHAAPRFKLGFLLLTLAPTILFQTAVATYDVPVFAACLLGTAMALRAFEREEPLGFFEALTCLSLLLLGTLAKPVYAVLLLMLLMIPTRRFSGKGHRILWCLFVVLLVALAFYSLTLPGPYDGVKSGDTRFEDVDSAAQLAWMLGNPLAAAGVILRYYFSHLIPWIPASQILWGFAGYVCTNRWVLILLLFLVAPFWHKEEKPGSCLTAGRRVALLALAVLPMLLLSVTQYVVSTAVGADSVAGVQARYFMPTLGVLMLALALPRKLRFAFRLPTVAAGAMVLYFAGCSWYTVWQLITTGPAVL